MGVEVVAVVPLPLLMLFIIIAGMDITLLGT